MWLPTSPINASHPFSGNTSTLEVEAEIFSETLVISQEPKHEK
jgi:hypothetical protein